MEPVPTITISCDSLLEFEEDAAAKAPGEPEFVKEPPPSPSGETDPAATNSVSPPLGSRKQPDA